MEHEIVVKRKKIVYRNAWPTIADFFFHSVDSITSGAGSSQRSAAQI